MNVDPIKLQWSDVYVKLNGLKTETAAGPQAGEEHQENDSRKKLLQVALKGFQNL